MIYVRIAAVLTVVAALTLLYNVIYQRGYDRAQTEYENRERLALISYAKRITDAGEQNEEYQLIINRLANKRVRVTFPVCPVAKTSTNQDGNSRILPNRIDEEFGRFQSRVEELINRCSQLNIDAIKLNAICAK